MKSIRLLCMCLALIACRADYALGGANIALGSTPSASGPGWGLGSYISDIVDGNQFYTDTNAHGLALPWTTSGTQWIELDFGATHSFDRVTLWHHFTNRIPPVATLEFWDGLQWNNISFSRSVPVTIHDGVPGSSASDEYTFTAVTGSKVKWSYDSALMYAATGQHAWIYEMEVFSSVPEPSSLVLFGMVGITLTTASWRAKRRKSALRQESTSS